jgi:hypothetical protein
MDLPKGEPCSSSETCLVSSYGGNWVAGIKVEEVTDVEEDPESITSPVIKTEHEVSCRSVCVQCHTHFTNTQNCVSGHMVHLDSGERIFTVLVKMSEGQCILWCIACKVAFPFF